MKQEPREKKPYPEDDPVTLFLRGLGFEVSAYYMGSTSLLLGASFEYKESEIVYRVEGDTIIIVIYHRLNNTAIGLKNSFEPFIWFSERLVYDIPEIKFMRGKPNALPALKDSALSSQKLLRFYCHLMGAEPDRQIGWYRFELANYKTMRERLNDYKNKLSRSS